MRTNKNARALIVQNGKIALIHRKKNGKEYWVTPGGGVEEGETPQEAMVREIAEEIGQEVQSAHLIYQTTEGETEYYYYRAEVNGEQLVMTGPELNPIGDSWYHPEWMEIEQLTKVVHYPVNLMELIEGSN